MGYCFSGASVRPAVPQPVRATQGCHHAPAPQESRRRRCLTDTDQYTLQFMTKKQICLLIYHIQQLRGRGVVVHWPCPAVPLPCCTLPCCTLPCTLLSHNLPSYTGSRQHLLPSTQPVWCLQTLHSQSHTFAFLSCCLGFMICQ